jgi:hypothetical protein
MCSDPHIFLLDDGIGGRNFVDLRYGQLLSILAYSNDLHCAVMVND